MHPNEAPGPDGITQLFFQKFWPIIKNDLALAVQQFFHTGCLSSALNSTFIALLPKLDHPTVISHYLPISLCNTLYKIISKILALWLSSFLLRFIFPYQTAFVKGRIIQENSILAAETFHTIKHKKGKYGYMAIKVNMAKAFDPMEWKPILQVLSLLSTFINWISSCISTASFSILLK